MGRLSNPPDHLETLALQGIAGSRKVSDNAPTTASHSPVAARSDPQEETGRLSNPVPMTGRVRANRVDARAEDVGSTRARGSVQRRLSGPEIGDLAAAYEWWRSLAELAIEFGIHHRTVAGHLERRGVPRRVSHRKMRSADVEQAARRYRGGDSLAELGAAFNVHPATVARELRRAGVKLRPRRGPQFDRSRDSA